MIWQLFQYVLLTTSEILVSITGLIFAYSQAPRRFKSVIMSAWLMTTAIGDLLVVFIAKFQLVEDQVHRKQKKIPLTNRFTIELGLGIRSIRWFDGVRHIYFWYSCHQLQRGKTHESLLRRSTFDPRSNEFRSWGHNGLDTLDLIYLLSLLIDGFCDQTKTISAINLIDFLLFLIVSYLLWCLVENNSSKISVQIWLIKQIWIVIFMFWSISYWCCEKKKSDQNKMKISDGFSLLFGSFICFCFVARCKIPSMNDKWRENVSIFCFLYVERRPTRGNMMIRLAKWSWLRWGSFIWSLLVASSRYLRICELGEPILYASRR